VTRDAKLLALLSLTALCAAWLCGVRFADQDLATAWHLLDPQLLRADLLRSLFYLHAQPPLLNLIVGVVLKVFGAHAPLALTVLWATCAIATSLATQGLATELGAPRWAAFAAGAVVAVAPATLLYVHHVGPEIATAAALTGSALFLARGARWKAFSLLGLACGLRSLLAPPLVLVALLAAGKRARLPALVVFAVLALLAVKNGLVVGTFSTSSWLGMNFARVTVARLAPAQRARLSPAAQPPPFGAVGEYAALIPVAPTGVPVLDEPRKGSGANNYNHLVYARAGRMLLRDDLRAIALAPTAVLSGWGVAWLQFFRPSDEWPFLAENRQHIERWAQLWDRAVDLEVPLPVLVLGQTEIYLTLLAGFTAVFAAAALSARNGPALWYSLLLIGWVAIVGNTFDVGENYRFRFVVEPVWIALAASLARRA
jgi:hypothetical protein